MTTYADILLKKALIMDLVKQFGYVENIKIKYELPDEDDEDRTIKLCFIVSEINPDTPVSDDNAGYLESKLAHELGCEVDVTVEQNIPTLGRYDTNKKSAFITDEKAIKEVIYRINNQTSEHTTLNDSDIAKIKFEDIVCKNIGGKDQWLQDGLLKKAEQYLTQKNSAQQTKKHSNPSDTTETPQKKPKLEFNGKMHSVILMIPIPEGTTYDKDRMENPELANELASEYLAKIGSSPIKSPVK